MNRKKRILSGMRPTGKLHLGHYWGVLLNWRALQTDYDCFYMIADWHSLTTEYEDPRNISENILEIARGWLAVGLDPEKSVLFRQSKVIEHAELHLLLSMITPLSWLYRCPTYKEQLKELKGKDVHTYGFLGYPVLQAADILLYQADCVPIGEDQVPHLELSREIARRFNNFYGRTFVEPQALLTSSPRLPGLDGRKMSKSYNNVIELFSDDKTIREKVGQMFTDPKKIRINDHGHPEGCVVFAYHRVVNKNWPDREKECRQGQVGCVACKKQLAELLMREIAPWREKYHYWEKHTADIKNILEHGNARARQVAEDTARLFRRNIRLE